MAQPKFHSRALRKELAVLIRWRARNHAETHANLCVSASCYRFSEDVVIPAIVMAELKLGKV
jgi:hypothetical protein